MFTRTDKSSYRKEKKMSKTNTNTNGTRYTINDADAAEFILAIYDVNKPVELTRNSNGDIEIDLRKLDGKITIQVKSGKVVAKLGHRDFPRVEDQILFVKRYFSKKSLMALADALNAEIKVLTDKVAARKAKIAARQNKMDNNGEMPRPTKDKKPGLPTGKVGYIGTDGEFHVDPEYRKKLDAQKKEAPPEKTPAPVKVGVVEKKHGKNRLGHIYGTIADELDNLFLSNVTEEELLKAGYTTVRIKSHFRHLLKDKASLVDVKFENGQYFAKYID